MKDRHKSDGAVDFLRSSGLGWDTATKHPTGVHFESYKYWNIYPRIKGYLT